MSQDGGLVALWLPCPAMGGIPWVLVGNLRKALFQEQPQKAPRRTASQGMKGRKEMGVEVIP